MKQICLFLLLAILTITQCTGQMYSDSWKDLDYAGDSLVSHRMDIYLPSGEQASYPAVVIIYGSAFFGNDMKQNAFDVLGEPLLKSGFAVVAVNHRSSRDTLFPAQIHDIKAAVRFIRARGNDYQIDPSFIGISGYSSGGHLSAMMGTSGSVKLLEGHLGNYTEFSSSVDAVADWFGPTDFQLMDSCGSTMVHDAPDSPESILIGAPVQESDELCALANPLSYIDADDPPFLIMHGDNDPLVPHCQSEMLHQALEEAGVLSEFILVPGARHGPGLFEEKYFDMMCDFFRKEFRKH